MTFDRIVQSRLTDFFSYFIYKDGLLTLTISLLEFDDILSFLLFLLFWLFFFPLVIAIFSEKGLVGIKELNRYVINLWRKYLSRLIYFPIHSSSRSHQSSDLVRDPAFHDLSKGGENEICIYVLYRVSITTSLPPHLLKIRLLDADWSADEVCF